MKVIAFALRFQQPIRQLLMTIRIRRKAYDEVWREQPASSMITMVKAQPADRCYRFARSLHVPSEFVCGSRGSCWVLRVPAMA